MATRYTKLAEVVQKRALKPGMVMSSMLNVLNDRVCCLLEFQDDTLTAVVPSAEIVSIPAENVFWAVRRA